jgi:hypothetical protein
MPTEAATDRIGVGHFFVTPGVATAHVLSGVAIFAGADRNDATLSSPLDCPESHHRCHYPDRNGRSRSCSLPDAGTSSHMVPRAIARDISEPQAPCLGRWIAK